MLATVAASQLSQPINRLFSFTAQQLIFLAFTSNNQVTVMNHTISSNIT